MAYSDRLNKKCPLCKSQNLFWEGNIENGGFYSERVHLPNKAKITIVCRDCCTEFRLGEYGDFSFEELADLWNGKKSS